MIKIEQKLKKKVKINKKGIGDPKSPQFTCQKDSSRKFSHTLEFTDLQAKFFKVLADPVRLQIIELLAQGPLCVCEIEPYFEKSQAAVSKHLKALLNAGIISLRPEGTKNIYSLKVPQVLDVMRVGEEYLNIQLKKQEEELLRLKQR